MFKFLYKGNMNISFQIGKKVEKHRKTVINFKKIKNVQICNHCQFMFTSS